MNNRTRFLFSALLLTLVFFMHPTLAAAQPDNATAPEEKTGSITGKFTMGDGKPMTGGKVIFFKTGGPVPDINKYWRVPDEVVDLNDKGEFSIGLAEGKYSISLMKRLSGRMEIGPPLPGDFFYEHMDEKGAPKLVSVNRGQDTNIGTMQGDVPFKGITVNRKNLTAIEGLILSEDGKPVEDALVFAYDSPQMKGRPLFVSDRTGKNGKFFVRLAEGGNYYLRARNVFDGGLPQTGEIMDFYGKEAPESVVVKTGVITTDIDIRITRFKGRGPSNE